MKSKSERIRKLRWELFRIKWKEFYVKYVRILLLAIIEIIAELYNNSKKG